MTIHTRLVTFCTHHRPQSRHTFPAKALVRRSSHFSSIRLPAVRCYRLRASVYRGQFSGRERLDHVPSFLAGKPLSAGVPVPRPSAGRRRVPSGPWIPYIPLARYAQPLGTPTVTTGMTSPWSECARCRGAVALLRRVRLFCSECRGAGRVVPVVLPVPARSFRVAPATTAMPHRGGPEELPKNNPSVHVASALARQLGACGLFRCDY
jgi:hypothetical protein